MLIKYSELKNSVMQATDGEIGRCKDFLYDDRDWNVRYMVADTRKWLPGRKIILAPGLLERPVWEEKRLPVKLTREQIESQPPLQEDPPLIQQIAQQGWIRDNMPFYWVGPGVFGVYEYPWAPAPERQRPIPPPDPDKAHLRSAEELMGYRIAARDGHIGHVEDVLLQPGRWAIRFIIVDTRNWLPGGRKVILSPHWALNVDWHDRTLAMAQTREAIQNSPEYDPDTDLSRADEASIFSFYGMPPYWEEEQDNGNDKA